ncbi:hypothetical protein COCC4DRAFT_189961 [Bipolaris maydis ATCC 48331]|uniref:Extracellular membrane protein CFEM domain-containing protein n=2 Tax=Cochliobolus heterostrophus TaxID=5016 RepID=M2U214_COCH5|nr:uncharacterized protein COCC4DRAFT_189961 [Bipolaris maydis ATCC 48331]EMD92604.1 hypothetical protein COCHEDRAFT_1174754 [Bipolaris maydis C5]KAH7553016.1 hypothetical protein BM1_07989 [Bipolaris maydis]ENI08300.1 hypothetical protein COCC4DRAFT_189961 [Bipolaris maydis ATCC 48331]KAJ5022412.1 hypothetical protein J3E73DRAFT_347298 [Bipolaris maydis]KAJ5061110.1 hypothetical protein J3E74DRAFT_337697 [Bipolaris maydis]
MAKLSLIATVAVLLSTAVARQAAVPEACCFAVHSGCLSDGAAGCVDYGGNQYCVQQNNDNDCKVACRKLLGQPSTANNFFLYTVYRGSNPTCFCTQWDASQETDSC